MKDFGHPLYIDLLQVKKNSIISLSQIKHNYQKLEEFEMKDAK